MVLFKDRFQLPSRMESELSPTQSILYAQVRQAGPTHGMDNENLLRIKSHPAVTNTIYLGDISKTLLKVLSGHSTPKVIDAPKFDEQKWTISTISGGLEVEITSLPYWGFGLFTNCYLNKITISGPIDERCRVRFDLAASLSHKAWEFSRNGKFNSKIANQKNNSVVWNEHIAKAKDDLLELIEVTKQEKGDSEEIEIARSALADDNAPAVLRALARLEAESIDIEVEDVSPDGQILVIEEEIPFIDLSKEEE